MKLDFNIEGMKLSVDVRKMTENGIVDIYANNSDEITAQAVTFIQDGGVAFKFNGKKIEIRDCIKYSMEQLADKLANGEEITSSELCNAIISDGCDNVKMAFYRNDNKTIDVCKLSLKWARAPHEMQVLSFKSIYDDNIVYDIKVQDLVASLNSRKRGGQKNSQIEQAGQMELEVGAADSQLEQGETKQAKLASDKVSVEQELANKNLAERNGIIRVELLKSEEDIKSSEWHWMDYFDRVKDNRLY